MKILAIESRAKRNLVFAGTAVLVGGIFSGLTILFSEIMNGFSHVPLSTIGMIFYTFGLVSATGIFFILKLFEGAANYRESEKITAVGRFVESVSIGFNPFHKKDMSVDA